MLTTYLLGLGSAVCFGVAAVIQQRVAFHAPPEDVLRLRLLLWLVRRPMWDVGVLLSAVGTFASAAALARSTVAFVAPLQVCQLLFALPLAAVWARRRVPRRDWAAAAATALGLATFLLAGDPHQGKVEAATTLGWILTCASIGGLATWAVLGTRRLDPARRATLLAGGAGLLSALQGALIGGVGRLVETSGVRALPTSWQTYAVVVVALTSGLLLQSAYEMAPLPASLPAAVSLEPLGGVAIGVFLLGGMLRLSPLAVVGEIAGLAVMIIGVRALAASPLVTGQLSRLHARTSQGQLSRLEDLLHRDLELLRDDLARGRRASTDRAQRRQYRHLHQDLDRIHCELARLVDDREHLDTRISTMRAAAAGAGAGHVNADGTGLAGANGTGHTGAGGTGHTGAGGTGHTGAGGTGHTGAAGTHGTGAHDPRSAVGTSAVASRHRDRPADEPAAARAEATGLTDTTQPGGTAVGAGLRRAAARIRLRTNPASGAAAPPRVRRGTVPVANGSLGRARRQTEGRPSVRVPGAEPGPGAPQRSGRALGGEGAARRRAASAPRAAAPRAAAPRAVRTLSPASNRDRSARHGDQPTHRRQDTDRRTQPPVELDDRPDVVSDHELAASQRALDARADALLAQAEELSARAEQVLRSLPIRPPH
ncbi:DMT(drug/metabolite transporter) superfamily permease [Frankia sp. EI5c]|uniref:DMT family transporter n=1 Tax=Frankia sp. EI5c TaxID=683316 RepID=UPI0007C220AA|nr:DMT family transporter [Frankia sp. EI5c]OAA29610.1 DMT(drug/metabolite transporter) superfamily permease [Frankia sp. EI5c]